MPQKLTKAQKEILLYIKQNGGSATVDQLASKFAKRPQILNEVGDLYDKGYLEYKSMTYEITEAGTNTIK